MSSQQQTPDTSNESGPFTPHVGNEEWPKKIRTLSAAELDRLTIDAQGRFYWDGQLVNYRSDAAAEMQSDAQSHSRTETALLAPTIQRERAGASGILVDDLHRHDVLAGAPALPQRTRVKLSGWQSLALLLAIIAMMVAAASLATQAMIASHEWGCRTGLLSEYCPQPLQIPDANLLF